MATVQDYTITSVADASNVISYLESNWTWNGGKTESGFETTLWVDTAKTIGLYFYVRSGVSQLKIGVKFKGTEYHLSDLQYPDAVSFKIEITSTALCFSFIDASSLTAENCTKIIVCDAHNSTNDTDEQVIIYLGSKASSNVSAIYASDVVTPYDLPAQNSNTGVSAKVSYMVPFYNKASAFVTTDVLQALTVDVVSWYFGNISLNNKPYRMSGSVVMFDN